MSQKHLIAFRLALACSLALASTTVLAGQPIGAPVKFQPSMSKPQSSPHWSGNPTLYGPAGGVNVKQSYDGIDFLGSNCDCLPPDTNAAVGGNFVVETVNLQIRVWDKMSGAVLLNESLAQFFGAPSDGDPFVVYDDIVKRWYVVAFNTNANGLRLAVSQTPDPTQGWNIFELTNLGAFPDYPKMGFTKDAIFISYNDFITGGAAATVATVDKKAALAGTLTYFVSRPAEFNFRGMPPAQLHGDLMGGVEWFVTTDGTDAGGQFIRVYRMTNYFSNAPTYTLTRLPVTPYKNAPRADQPGGAITTQPNTTFYELEYRHGHLVSAMASGLAGDGFTYPKGLYYVIDVTRGTPTLEKQGVIDRGTGVAVQMPSVDEDLFKNLGLTWFESSSSEYMSMWVGAVNPFPGVLRATNVTPTAGFLFANSRIGDYSTTVLDADGLTFWSANEYVGTDGATDIWRTHIASFTAGPLGPVASH